MTDSLKDATKAKTAFWENAGFLSHCVCMGEVHVFNNNLLSKAMILKISNMCVFSFCGKFDCSIVDRKRFCDIELCSQHVNDIEANIIN